MIAKLKSKIKELFHEQANFYSRYKDGYNDLKKGVLNGKPILKTEKDDILNFWKPYLIDYRTKKSFDIRWFNIYKKTNIYNYPLKYYIPDGYYYCIVDNFFSNGEKAKILDDKNLYDLYFYDVLQPTTICRKEHGIYLDKNYNVISENHAISLCKANGQIIIKPSVDACAGSGIVKWDSSSSNETLRQILNKGEFLIIQDVVKQHEVLNKFNSTCVNTLRMVTLLLDGKFYLCASVIIMGGKDAITNHLHSGGLVCGIKSSGQLMDTAFDSKLNEYRKHPNGVVFSECFIPNYNKCVDLVKKLAPRFIHVSKLISWDLTINDKGDPLLIETNLYWGGSVQIAGGPVFGNMTPEVLDYIMKHYK